MRIAILGATSQIAKDLILTMAAHDDHELILYARSVAQVEDWLDSHTLKTRYRVCDYSQYGHIDHDAVINFVGVGDPSRAASMGSSIFGITLHYDQLVMNYLDKNPECRYLFLSSGAAYGSTFLQPASEHTPASIQINSLAPQEYYSVAKLYAECTHRSKPDLAIVDLRVFNYFSRTLNTDARFFITDTLRAIHSNSVLKTSPDPMMRDFQHPSDFHQMVDKVLKAPPMNRPLDCYSREPIEKMTLLNALKVQFGLQFEVVPGMAAPVNATGVKPNYYSRNHAAGEYGYEPVYSSLDTVITEATAILSNW